MISLLVNLFVHYLSLRILHPHVQDSENFIMAVLTASQLEDTVILVFFVNNCPPTLYFQLFIQDLSLTAILTLDVHYFLKFNFSFHSRIAVLSQVNVS